MAVDFNTIKYRDNGNGRITLTWEGTATYFWVVLNGALLPGCPTVNNHIDFTLPADKQIDIQIIENNDIEYDYTQELDLYPDRFVAINWMPSVDTDIEYFNVYAGESAGSLSLIARVPYRENQRLYNYNYRATPNQFAYFKVTEVDKAGNESSGCGVEHFWLISFPSPPASINLSYVQGTKTATITWTASPDLEFQ